VRRSFSLIHVPLLLILCLGAISCASSSREDQLLRELADLDKQTIFDRAEELYEAGKYRESRELYSFVYDTFPNDPLGHKAALRVADTYAKKKDSTSLTEARLRYKDFANRYPNDPDRDYALLMLGQTYSARHQRPERDLAPLHEGLDAYQQLLNLYPDSPHVPQAREDMAVVKETLAEHEWIVARFYVRNRRWAGVVGRLEYLKEQYPDYSRMDKVDETLAVARAEIEKFQALVKKLQAEVQAEVDKTSENTDN
jgi:outer membrane protein assembly factor BamD